MTTLKFTQAVKDAWLTRLRDPNSRQAIGKSTPKLCEYFDTGKAVSRDDSMCCLVHGQYAIEGEAFVYSPKSPRTYWDWAKDYIPDHMYTLQSMNDSGNYSLPQIADYIEANIPVVEE